MEVNLNHFGIISLSATELRLYLSDIDQKWDFEGWDNAILQGLILREDEDGDIVFTVANGLWAQKNGGLPATQDMFSSKDQALNVEQLFKSKKFGAWVRAWLNETNNDYVGLVNSSRFKDGIMSALDKQRGLQKDWVLGIDPDYRQPYELEDSDGLALNKGAGWLMRVISKWVV